MPVNQGQLIASTWEAKVGKSPEDQVFTSRWLFYNMSMGKGFMSVPGGRLAEIPLEYSENSTVRSYTDLETLDTTRVDVFDVARFDWKEVSGTMVISELEKARNQGENAKFPLLANKMQNLKDSFEAVLNRMLFGDGTGNSSKDFAGLQQIIPNDPTTGIVGGINRNTWSFWRSRQTSGAQTATPFDNLRASMRSVYNQCSNGAFDKHPTWIVSNRTVFEGYEGLLTANERFTSKDEAEGGFKNETFKYKGAKMAFDEDNPAGNMYFGNPEFLKLAYLKSYWMKGFPAVDPANQTADIFKVLTIGNLITNHSRRLGVVTGIT